MQRLCQIILILMILSFESCSTGNEKDRKKEQKNKTEKAEAVIEKAIAFHGMKRLSQDTLKFDFRERTYVFKTNNEAFQYERILTDSSGTKIRDVLTNKGLKRFRDDSLVSLSAEDSTAYANSVNSVIYFAFLPYQLDDAAVLPSYKGKDTIKGEIYHQIEVNFKEKGGGKDHQDTFMYWFHIKNASMDFLAYRYHTEGGGVRFREASNRRRIDSILIQDYHNYKAPYDATLRKLDEQWEKGNLEKLSEINLNFTNSYLRN